MESHVATELKSSITVFLDFLYVFKKHVNIFN